MANDPAFCQGSPRVLFVNHSAQPGGAERCLQDLIARLPGRHGVALFQDGPFCHLLRTRGVDVSVYPETELLFSTAKTGAWGRRVLALRHLPGLLRRMAAQAAEFDVIYVNTKKAVLPAVLVARRIRRPLIWHQHDVVQQPRTLGLRARLSEALIIALLNRHANRVISVSRACADAFTAAGGRRDLPVVVHNGIEVGSQSPGPENALRASLGIDSRATLVACFGRMARLKGQWVLLDALRELAGVHVVFAGGDVLADAGYEEMLRQRVRQYGLTERVHFLGYRDDVLSLMRQVDIAVNPSVEFESSGRLTMEAMWCATPVIATAIGGAPELIEHGRTGLLVTPSDASALAGAIAFLVKRPEERYRMGSAAHAHAQLAFGVDRYAAEVREHIMAVAERSRRPAVHFSKR